MPPAPAEECDVDRVGVWLGAVDGFLVDDVALHVDGALDVEVCAAVDDTDASDGQGQVVLQYDRDQVVLQDVDLCALAHTLDELVVDSRKERKSKNTRKSKKGGAVVSVIADVLSDSSAAVSNLLSGPPLALKNEALQADGKYEVDKIMLQVTGPQLNESDFEVPKVKDHAAHERDCDHRHVTCVIGCGPSLVENGRAAHEREGDLRKVPWGFDSCEPSHSDEADDLAAVALLLRAGYAPAAVAELQARVSAARRHQ
jgi:hypothetical protein